MSFLNNIFSDVARTSVGQVANKVIGTLANPVMSRLQSSGLLPGGTRPTNFPYTGPSVSWVENGPGSSMNDWKVSINVSPSSGIFYHAGSGILDPLRSTNGVVFPYTPQIDIIYQANYNPQRFTHSNYNQFAYENSEIQQIQIRSEFTAQNKNEASYVLACIYFFRAATKMFFGASPNAGNPPPLVFLNGYGTHYFNNVPCIVTMFNHSLPSDVDYIETGAGDNSNNLYTNDNYQTYFDDFGDFNQSGAESRNNMYDSSSGGGGITRIPTHSSINIALQPIYSKASIAQFNLEDFAQGRLVDKGFL